MADLADTLAALADELRRTPHQRVAYRVEDAAEMVGVSRSAMYRMTKDGTVRIVPNMGSRVVISHTELVRVFGGGDTPLEVAS